MGTHLLTVILGQSDRGGEGERCYNFLNQHCVLNAAPLVTAEPELNVQGFFLKNASVFDDVCFAQQQRLSGWCMQQEGEIRPLIFFKLSRWSTMIGCLVIAAKLATVRKYLYFKLHKNKESERPNV